MDIEQINDRMNEAFEQILEEDFKVATTEQLGQLRGPLDVRAVPGRIWYSEESIVVRSGSSVRMLEYYGGWEYVDSSHKATFGDYTVYSSDGESRVAQVVDILNGNIEEEDDE